MYVRACVQLLINLRKHYFII